MKLRIVPTGNLMELGLFFSSSSSMGRNWNCFHRKSLPSSFRVGMPWPEVLKEFMTAVQNVQSWVNSTDWENKNASHPTWIKQIYIINYVPWIFSIFDWNFFIFAASSLTISISCLNIAIRIPFWSTFIYKNYLLSSISLSGIPCGFFVAETSIGQSSAMKVRAF